MALSGGQVDRFSLLGYLAAVGAQKSRLLIGVIFNLSVLAKRSGQPQCPCQAPWVDRTSRLAQHMTKAHHTLVSGAGNKQGC